MTIASPSKGVFYDSRSSQLVIGAANVARLDIVSVDGRRVEIAGFKNVGETRVLDLSSLRAGVYIARFSTGRSTQTMKFVKQ